MNWGKEPTGDLRSILYAQWGGVQPLIFEAGDDTFIVGNSANHEILEIRGAMVQEVKRLQAPQPLEKYHGSQ